MKHPIAMQRTAGGSENRGNTLIELVVAIVVISIAVTSVLSVLSSVSVRSSEAMIREQAVSIASSYLEEILLKDYTANGVEASRALYDDIFDYNNLVNNGVFDQNGSQVNGLGQYTVAVAVASSALGGITLASNEAALITVTVTHVTGLVVVLSGYRTKQS